jgi:hypothetical protein
MTRSRKAGPSPTSTSLHHQRARWYYASDESEKIHEIPLHMCYLGLLEREDINDIALSSLTIFIRVLEPVAPREAGCVVIAEQRL